MRTHIRQKVGSSGSTNGGFWENLKRMALKCGRTWDSPWSFNKSSFPTHREHWRQLHSVSSHNLCLQQILKLHIHVCMTCQLYLFCILKWNTHACAKRHAWQSCSSAIAIGQSWELGKHPVLWCWAPVPEIQGNLCSVHIETPKNIMLNERS